MNVNVDPVELRRFAKQLQDVSTELGTQMSRLKGGLNGLNQSWRDQENAKFVEKFNQSTNPLLKLIAEMDAYSKFLNSKAVPIEEFLKHRL
jgi:uncharacterized protein YukE